MFGLALVLAALAAGPRAWAGDVVRMANPDPAEGDAFGTAVAVSSRGSALVAVGAPGDDTFADDAGAVYLFQDGEPIATLSAVSPAPGGRFGSALALVGDRLLVGAPYDGADGAVYVFDVKDPRNWAWETTLVPVQPVADGSFGSAVAGQKDTVVVGAPFENAGRVASGAVYVFERVRGIWKQAARVVLPGTPGQLVFGTSVAIDGDTIVAGAPYFRLQFIVGSAYVIERDREGWALRQRLMSPLSTPRDRFGSAAVISGGRISVGAPRDAPPPIGYVASFRKDASTWEAEGYVTSPKPEPFDRFGVALATDGSRLLAGAFGAGSGSGAAFVFRREGDGWEYESTLAPGPLGGFDRFGSSVAISSGRMVVGAPGDAEGGFDSGAVYVFRGDGGS